MLNVQLEAYGIGGMWKRYHIVDMAEKEIIRVSITKYGLQDFITEYGIKGYAFFDSYKEAENYVDGKEW